jgi:hypothetical protein
MNVLKRRSRMVSFRLSEEEYESLRDICMTAGARSLSDIARDAVHQLIGSGGDPKKDKDIETQVRLLNERMDAIDQEVRRLAAKLEPHAAAPVTFDAAGS